MGQFMLIVIGEAVGGHSRCGCVGGVGSIGGTHHRGSSGRRRRFLVADVRLRGGPGLRREAALSVTSTAICPCISPPVAFGVGAGLAVEHGAKPALLGAVRGIICVALAIYLVGVMLVRMGSRGRSRRG